MHIRSVPFPFFRFPHGTANKQGKIIAINPLGLICFLLIPILPWERGWNGEEEQSRAAGVSCREGSLERGQRASSAPIPASRAEAVPGERQGRSLARWSSRAGSAAFHGPGGEQPDLWLAPGQGGTTDLGRSVMFASAG